jgi:hypothetical protein
MVEEGDEGSRQVEEGDKGRRMCDGMYCDRCSHSGMMSAVGLLQRPDLFCDRRWKGQDVIGVG